MLPNVVLPGVSHAGATRLAADLALHPQVCVPTGPGPDFYRPMLYGRRVDVHEHDYDRHFAGWQGERYRVEVAPGYFDGGVEVARAMAARVPGLRAVVLLRDPAERVWSSYVDLRSRGRLPHAMSYDTFVDRCLALRANDVDRFEGNRHFRSLGAGLYAEHLTGWLDTFGRRARVLFTEDLAGDAPAQVGALLDWLGLNPELLEERDPLDPVVTYPQILDPAARRGGWPRWLRPARTGRPAGEPRRPERAHDRVRGLYAASNAEVGALLRDRGYTSLPAWLAP